MQKLITLTIDLESGCGAQDHLEGYLEQGWRVIQVVVGGAAAGSTSSYRAFACMAVVLEHDGP